MILFLFNEFWGCFPLQPKKKKKKNLGNYLQYQCRQFGNLRKYTVKVGQDHWIFIFFVMNYDAKVDQDNWVFIYFVMNYDKLNYMTETHNFQIT